MKFGFIFSICALLLIYFQLSVAVICLSNTGERNCTSCVMYKCSVEAGPLIDGCPDDFFKNCSKHTEFIKSKNYNDMEFYDPKDNVLYISGCGNEIEGRMCIELKFVRIYGKGIKDAFCIEGGKPCVVPDDKPADSGSNDQNGALKLIGILSFGWLLSTAAWNLY
uniref:Uncharacterized protein n=1 Tax=Panagrolaimus davidi TaxID=227884 RepID=A0A914QZ40_9BILA